MGHTLSTSTARRMAGVVRKVERALPGAPRQGGGNDGSGNPSFWAELTSEGTGDDVGWYSWKMIWQAPLEDSGWKDASPSITGSFTAREANLTSGMTGSRVRMEFSGYDGDSNPVYMFGNATGGLFPVNLTKDGGDAGDKTTQCSFTYTVKTLNGVPLATEQSPAMQRPEFGEIVDAKIGSAYIPPGGSIVLHWCDEVEKVVDCDEGE